MAEVRSSELINENLRAHALGLAEWEPARIITTAHEWFARFTETFALEISTPAIAIEQLRHATLGTYRPERNGLGLLFEIALNADFVKNNIDRPCLILETLLHEAVHMWEHVHVTNSGKARRYHSLAFRKKLLELGIEVDQHGYHLRVISDSPFVELLKQHNIDTIPLFKAESLAERAMARVAETAAVSEPKERSTMRKWTCGCGTNIRAAVEVRARCLKCNTDFQRAASGSRTTVSL